MGSIPLTRLFLQQARSADDAREVSAIPLRTQVSAMCIGKSVSGDLVYRKEVEIFLTIAWRVVIDAKHRHSWLRMEAKVETKNDDIRPHHQLVVAEHPYSVGWLRYVPFKPGSKEESEERAQFHSSDYQSLADLIAACEALPYDFWETGDFLTAGISEPELTFDPLGSPRNVQKQALYVFGSCESLSDYEKALLTSQSIKELVRQTETGTLKFWFKDAELTELPQLFDETKEDASRLMILSVRQALAGPHRDSQDWIGRPVAEKVDQIYRGHINARNRRVAEERNRLEPYDDFQRHMAGEESDGESKLSGANLVGADLPEADFEKEEGIGVLHIPLREQVPAGQLGQLLSSLASLYEVSLEISASDAPSGYECLTVKRLSVGTPNVAEFVGLLSDITAIAAALLIIIKIPKSLGEGAKNFSEARKIWIEGTLLKNKHIGNQDVMKANYERIESSFASLERSSDLICGKPVVRSASVELSEERITRG